MIGVIIIFGKKNISLYGRVGTKMLADKIEGRLQHKIKVR